MPSRPRRVELLHDDLLHGSDRQKTTRVTHHRDPPASRPASQTAAEHRYVVESLVSLCQPGAHTAHAMRRALGALTRMKMHA